MAKFPKVLFVSVREDRGDEWFVTQEEEIDCIEDDGPTPVAKYQLVSVSKLKKVSKAEGNK